MPRKKTIRRFALVEKEILYSRSWASLSDSAKVIYVHLKGEYNGSNEDNLKLPYSTMKNIVSNATYWRGIKSLEEAGFIDIVFHGGIPERGLDGYEKKKPNIYKISNRWRLKEQTLQEHQKHFEERKKQREYREFVQAALKEA
jgi:hypothetical protein